MPDRLTRVERSLIETFVKTNGPTIRAGLSRAHIETDDAGVSTKVTGLLIGNVCSFPVYRNEDLANAHRDVYGADGVLIVST